MRNLFVAPLAEPRKGRQITHVTDRNIGGYYQWAHTNRHIVFFQERDGDENWRASSVDLRSGALKLLTPERGVRALFQEESHLFPEEMLLRHNGRDRTWFDLYRVNVVTGASTLVYENRSFSWLVTDSSFRLRLGGRYAADGSLEVAERRGDGWVPFTTVPIGDLDGTRLIDFSADGSTFYMIDTRGRDKAALVAIDMASRKAKVLAADDEADIVRAELDHRTRLPLAALAVRARRRWHAIDARSQDRPGAPRRLGQRRPGFREPQPRWPPHHRVLRARRRQRRVCAARASRAVASRRCTKRMRRAIAWGCGQCSRSRSARATASSSPPT